MVANVASFSEHGASLGTIDFTLKSDKPFKSVHVKISTTDGPPEVESVDDDPSKVRSIPYTVNKIFVSNETPEKIQCYISKHSGPEGGDGWYNIGPGFNNQGWHRIGWEVVVFRNEADTKRVGFYINNTKRTTEIRFRSFTDVDIVHSK